MTTVVDSLPAHLTGLFVEIMGFRDGTLLATLRNEAEPSLEQREAVTDIFSDEFTMNLRPDLEPTDRGVLIDDLLGAFLLRWPIEWPDDEPAG